MRRPRRHLQPTLSDIPRLVEESRRAGAKIDFEMQVDQADVVPGSSRPRRLPDSPGSAHEHRQARRRHGCRGTGRPATPAAGLHVIIRNRQPVHSHAGPKLPGAGAGLLGLQERVTLAGGTLVHGPDGSGGFVVDAELPWAG